MSYFSDLVAQGATGTDDPYAAGFSGGGDDPYAATAAIPPAGATAAIPPGGARFNRPAYPTVGNGSASADIPPRPNDAYAATAAVPGRGQSDVPPGLAFYRMLQGGGGGPGLPSWSDPLRPPAASVPPPPPIPGPLDMPGAAPAASAAPAQFGAGGATDPRVLARLNSQFNAPPVAAPPAAGGNVSDYIRLPVGGQPGSTPFTNGMMGPAGGAPAPRPAVGPGAPSGQAAGGGGLMDYVRNWQNSPDSKPYTPATLAPDFHDKLLRFGLATMAAGGKPGATTLGAIGEGGVSALDYAQKAQQGDITNTLEAHKAGVSAQSPILKAYEVLATLQQSGQNHQLSIAAQQQSRQDAMDLKALIAGGNQNLVQQKLEEIASRDQAAATARTEANATRSATQQENANNHAAVFYQHQIDTATKANPLGVTPEAEMKITRDTAMAHPQSVYAAQWNVKKATALDDARQFIQDHPAEKPKAVLKLRQMGIDPRDL